MCVMEFEAAHSVKHMAMRSSFVVPQAVPGSERNCFNPMFIDRTRVGFCIVLSQDSSHSENMLKTF